MSLWNSNLIHSQLYGFINDSSYTLDFFADSVTKRVITMNIMLNYRGQELILENVIANNQNNLYGMMVASGVEVPDAADLASSIMNKLSNQRFVVPKLKFE